MNLVDSLYQYKLDIYTQVDDQDPDTGALIKEWHYVDTLSCGAKGIVSNSASTRTYDKQSVGNRYKFEQFVEIRTAEKINIRHKITNIRNAKGVPIWTELDYPSETPTVFEVIGVTPITDPFGTIVAYNTTIKRSENQQIGI